MNRGVEPLVTPTLFVTNFPAFADTENYPTPVVQFYIEIAYRLLNVYRWGSLYNFGIQLFVAHNLYLERLAQAQADTNAPAGGATGPVASKGAGPLSISWDTSSAAEENAGHYNDSTYGQRFIRLARLLGAGGLQLGVGAAPPLSGPAWSGPPPWPGWFSS